MEIVDRRVPLSQVGRTVGPCPVERFIENVRRHGVVVPVLLRELVSGDGVLQFAIIDGNRRVAAARRLGLPDVPARIVNGISADDAARLTLIGNNFRSANDITEFWAIKHLERSGQRRRHVAEDAGISEQYLRLRDRWSTLDRRIFLGFAEGRIAATVANKISRLPPGEQRELGDIFAAKGAVLTHDVERVATPRASARRRSANDLPDVPIYEPVPVDASSVRIISVPVGTGDTRLAPDRVHETVLSDRLRQAIAAAVSRGIAEGVPLGDLTGALAIAYREAMDTQDVAGEQHSGRDYQS